MTTNGASHHGFAAPQTGLIVAGVLAVALGTLLIGIDGLQPAGGDLDEVGDLLTDLGVIAAGAALVWAAFRSTHTSAAFRSVQLILGVLLAFGGFSVGASFGF